MQRTVFLFALALLFISANANLRTTPSEAQIVMTKTSNSKPHALEANNPSAVCVEYSSVRVTLDATHYASYTVTLTSPAGDSVTVNATSPTVTIPVNDGVFSRSGASTVTLTDQQA